MPDNLVTGAGQVPPGPQSPDGNGQVPPTSQDATNTNAAHGDTSPGESPTSLSEAQLRDALEKARKENAKYRVDAKRLAELEAAEQQRQEAQLSEQQRQDKKLADLQAKYEDLQRQSQERVIRSDIRAAAEKLGIKAELAYRLLDYAAISFNDDGDPTNISDLLASALEQFGLTSAPSASQQQQPPQTQRPPMVPQTGATNPPRGSQVVGANGRFSRDEIPRLSDPRLWKRGN